MPWNAPQLEDVNPASAIARRLIERFGGSGGTGRASAGSDGVNGGDGADGMAGLAGADGAGTAGGVGVAGSNGRNAAQIAALQSLLNANGISYGAVAAGTSIYNQVAAINARLDAASGEGICNEDGTITITLTI